MRGVDRGDRGDLSLEAMFASDQTGWSGGQEVSSDDQNAGKHPQPTCSQPVRTFQSDRKIQAGVGCSSRLVDPEGQVTLNLYRFRIMWDLFTTFVLLRSSKHSLNIKSCWFLQ